MKIFEDQLNENIEFVNLCEHLKKSNEPVSVSGCIDSQQVNLMSGITGKFNTSVVVTYDDKRAREIYEDFQMYDKNVVYYPAKDFIFFNADIHGNLYLNERLAAIKRIIDGEHVVIITTIAGLMDKLIPIDCLKDNIFSINIDDKIDLDDIKNKLTNMSYERVSQVDMPGQYSIRGEILDIYPVCEDYPVRVDLWDDEIDSIKIFDAESQRSIENIDGFTIYPATEFILSRKEIEQGIKKIRGERDRACKKFKDDIKPEEASRIRKIINEFTEQLELGNKAIALDSYVNYFYEEMSSLMQYLENKDTVYLLDEPNRLAEKSETIMKEFADSMSSRLEKGYILSGQIDVINSYEKVLSQISKNRIVVFTALNQKLKDIAVSENFNIEAKSIVSYNNSFELLVKDLKNYRKKGYKVLLFTNSRTKAERLVDTLRDYELEAVYSDDMDRKLQPREIVISYGNVQRGFEYPMMKFVVITQSDIMGKEKSRKKRQKKQYSGKRIQDFNQLKVGDYVVHENHGLGIYRGIEKIEVDKVEKDYIKIEYAGNSNLYILATQLDVIQKYADGSAKDNGAAAPKLNKLGTQEWTKTKTRVKTAVKDIAKDLVEIYSARQNQKGYQFEKDTVWQTEFEEMFPFEETNDQLKAINDTKRDMESDKIMDRLICGDVGYGKTEIAIRAAFKAVADGKQVAMLVPTTILAQQHYNTFSQRMKDYPIRVELLSRFRTAAGVKATLEGLKNGSVDIVIGTHKLLSKSIVYKDLGLLIVDEEQRFGVTHKEKIKQLKKNIDVLTLTATPIPRTLHMSLVGIRDMSVLEEPPIDRMPIQTYVMEYDDEMVREAINRELLRNGQVYYVYNRVNNIEEIANHIAKLVPDANVVYAHGQMNERKLEQIMYDFIEGEIDVLVSTTIIETGLDISNVNTIIIHDADSFGLSQLYQLRGRVGRSTRTSYAFLLYKRDKMIKEVAEKRLQAIKEFTELGSGFKIAMRDLEIRGAGNVLGAEQHGHMAAVGYDLYCKLLNEAVAVMKGEKEDEDFETKIDIELDAFIPPKYIKNEMQRINVYKQIASIENQEDFQDMEDELMDRFGEMPKNLINLLNIALIKANAHRVYITEIKQLPEKLKITMYKNAKIDVAKIGDIIKEYKGKLKFIPDIEPYFMLDVGRKKLTVDEYKEITDRLVEALDDIKLEREDN